MACDPRLHQRESLRLRGYDYAEGGAYFVTVCVQGHKCLFGAVVNGEMRLNEWGRIVEGAWCDLPNHYLHVVLDAFVVMPNHVHMIVVLTDLVGAGLKPSPMTSGCGETAGDEAKRAGFKPAPTRRHALSEIVRAFKTFSSRRINERRDRGEKFLWQRNYYEHIIRNEVALERIREYILTNLATWATDRENPQAKSFGQEKGERVDR